MWSMSCSAELRILKNERFKRKQKSHTCHFLLIFEQKNIKSLDFAYPYTTLKLLCLFRILYKKKEDMWH